MHVREFTYLLKGNPRKGKQFSYYWPPISFASFSAFDLTSSMVPALGGELARNNCEARYHTPCRTPILGASRGGRQGSL
jgi:hypothetical protein